MKRHQPSEAAAKLAADSLAKQLRFDPKTRIGLVLGTGWGDSLKLEDSRECPFSAIPGFEALGRLDGHARKVMVGTLAGKPVVVLSGRVHVNEAPADPNIHRMVRLQIEMLLQLGVDRLVLTCAVGGLNAKAGVGQVVIINSLVTLFAPEMPLYVGEFCSPEDTFDSVLIERVKEAGDEAGLKGWLTRGAYAMVRGPYFETVSHDKRILRDAGADVVGMSILPELCVAAMYPGVKAVSFGYVTNNEMEAHSHETNVERARSESETLGALLAAVVGELGREKRRSEEA